MGKGYSNLKPVKSKEEARERGHKGGIASGKSKRRKKEIREYIQALLESEITGKNGEKIKGAEAMAIKVFQQALKGDWKAWELTRDTAGQKPVDKVMLSEVDQDVIEEVEMIVNESNKDS